MNPQEPLSLDLSHPEPTTVQISTDPRQQVIDRLKGSVNILITVSPDPSVDQLAASIGFTLALNKLSKHSTTVFSGATPPAIDFLEPSKTIQKDIDSLRDFIIALDKSKADKLRYKVEDRFVKIFITPYHTDISDKDLEFSQGDYNVDVIIALGVTRREYLDQAITAHGRILHDATVISINKDKSDDIGVINWHVPGASSYCEILVDLIENLKTAETELFDGQIATAFLTGIVAETERFSNDKTTPQTMSTAGILMKAGANQQLISSNLESAGSVPKAPATSTLLSPPPAAIIEAVPPVTPVAGSAAPKIPDAPAIEIIAAPTPETPAPPIIQQSVQAIPDNTSVSSGGPLGVGDEEASHISLDMPESTEQATEQVPEPKIDNIDIDSDGTLHKFGDPDPLDVVASLPEPSFADAKPPAVDRVDQSLEEIENAINSPHLKVNGGETVLSPEHGGQPTTPIAALNAIPIDLDLGHDGQPGLKLPNPFKRPLPTTPEPSSAPLINQFNPAPPPVITPPEPIVTTLPPPPASPPPMIPPVV